MALRGAPLALQTGMKSPMPWLRSYLGVHLLRVLAMPLDRVHGNHPAHSHLDYAALTEKEVLGWCSDAELELDEARVRAAYQRGDVCVAALDAGRLIGYMWFAFNAVPHIHGVWVQVGAAARYSYKSFVRPSHRGRGIAPQMYRRANQICPRRGRSLNVLIVDLDNKASLRASYAAGRVTVGYAGFLCLLGKTFTFRSPGARRCGFGFYRPQPLEARRSRVALWLDKYLVFFEP
jgi:GNAT superfamily N-acetyltransferase